MVSTNNNYTSAMFCTAYPNVTTYRHTSLSHSSFTNLNTNPTIKYPSENASVPRDTKLMYTLVRLVDVLDLANTVLATG